MRTAEEKATIREYSRVRWTTWRTKTGARAFDVCLDQDTAQRGFATGMRRELHRNWAHAARLGKAHLVRRGRD